MREIGGGSFAENSYFALLNEGIQDLLDNPNPKSPAQREAYEMYVSNRAEYRRRVKEEARKNPPDA